MPRFVILEHATPAKFAREANAAPSSSSTHWDFMLEQEGELLTWALDAIPVENRTLAAIQLPNHRLAYLEYEGDISGDRGSVHQMDSGNFSWIEQGESRLILLLQSQNGAFRVTLTRMEESRWTIQFESAAQLNA